MTDTPRVLLLASAAALALSLSQSGWASEDSTAAAPAIPETTAETVVTPPAAPIAEVSAAADEAPAESQPQAPATVTDAAPSDATPADAAPAESARAKAEARRAEMNTTRNKRYQELRERAAEVGLTLPETPPWESAEAAMHQMPAMPAMPKRMEHAVPDQKAMLERREAMRERMKQLSPEERQAVREAHWAEMRERAAERGIDMPQTPPWEDAEKRYKEAQAQFEKYRQTIDEMSAEQLEAARAIFGHSPELSQPPARQMPSMPPRQMHPMNQMPQMRQMPQGYGYGPQGGYPSQGPYQGGINPMQGMGQQPMPGYDRGMNQIPPYGGGHY